MALLPQVWTHAMSVPSPPADAAPLAAELENSYEELRRYASRKYAAAADDLLHDAWLRLASRADASAGTAAVRDPVTYLRRIVDNLAVDRHRLAASRNRFLSSAEKHEDIASPAPSPYQVALSEQEYAVLQQAVRDLPAQARRVFILFRGRGLSMAQIAAQLGISPRTVEKHIAVAVAHCRRRLRDAGRDV